MSTTACAAPEPVGPGEAPLEYPQLGRLGLTSGRRHAAAVATLVVSHLVLGSVATLVLLLPAGGVDRESVWWYCAVNASVLCLLVGVAVAVRWVHRRPLRTLVTARARVDVRRLAASTGVFLVALTAARGVEALVAPAGFSLVFEPARWLAWLPLVLLVTPLQALAEELVFRGYALQALGLLTRRRWLLVATSAALFTFPHLANRELDLGATVLVAYYAAFGALLAWVTLREGRLEVAIGAHVANNLSAALLVASAGSTLGTPTIWQASDAEPLHHLVAFAGAAALACWLLLRRPATTGDDCTLPTPAPVISGPARPGRGR